MVRSVVLVVVGSVMGLACESGGGDGDVVPDTDPPAAIGACDGTFAPAQPFGTRPTQYTSDAVEPSVASRAAQDQLVRDRYDAWKAKYIKSGCGGRYYVDASDNSQTESLTFSESNGYGMLITVYMAGHDPDAKTIFDGLFGLYADHPASNNADLMAWSIGADCQSNRGSGSATDGDLDVAYALLTADKQWGSGGDIDYAGEAVRIMDALQRTNIHRSRKFALVGDWARTSDDRAHRAGTRPSDFMPGHFAAFESYSGDERWRTLLDAGYENMQTLQDNFAPKTGFVPDFAIDADTEIAPPQGRFLESPDTDRTYYYNACRAPWRVAMHYLLHGDDRARARLSNTNAWLRASTGQDPTRIVSGYKLDGSPATGSSNNYRDWSFIGPFAVGAMTDPDAQPWVDALWGALDTIAGTRSYYGDTLQLASAIALSGNWWAPELVSCPTSASRTGATTASRVAPGNPGPDYDPY